MKYLLFLLITLLSEILGTIGGFGSSIFMVSISQFFFNFQTVLAITGLLHVFSNASKMWLFRKSIDWKTSLLLGIPGVVFVLLGSWLTTIIRFTWAEAMLGLLLIITSSLLWLKPALVVKPSTFNAIAGGGLAGFLAGFVGTGGALRGILLAGFNFEKGAFVATSATIDMGVDLSRSFVYLGNGYMPGELFFLIPFLIGLSLLGSWIGKLLLDRISQEVFRKIILGLVFCIGVALVGRFLYALQ